jgi:hypothetical protein
MEWWYWWHASFNSHTSTLNNEKYNLKNDFIIQSCNTFNKKTQKIEGDGFTTSSNSMIMDFTQFNEEKKA